LQKLQKKFSQFFFPQEIQVFEKRLLMPIEKKIMERKMQSAMLDLKYFFEILHFRNILK